MKRDIDIGLAIGSSKEYKRRLHLLQRWCGRVGGWTYPEIAARCKTSPQAMQQLCERTLVKVRYRLNCRGVSMAEGLMILEMMSKQGSYRHYNEDI